MCLPHTLHGVSDALGYAIMLLPSFVSPSSCTELREREGKAPFATTSFKKEGGLIFEIMVMNSEIETG